MGELVASCNMHVTFFSQSAVVDMADLHMSNSPDLNQVGCLRSHESAGSASQQITDDETVQEVTLDMDTSQHTEEIENLNPVRRSTRERRQPSWLRI
jgi:hypothetical protein